MHMRTDQYRFLFWLLMGLFVVATLVLRPFFGSLVLAGAIAVALAPITAWIHRVVPIRGFAALLNVLGVVVLILAPLLTLGALALEQATGLYLTLATQTDDIPRITLALQNTIGTLLPDAFAFTDVDLTAWATTVVRWAVTHIGVLLSSLLQGVATFVLMLLVLYYFFKDGQELRTFIVHHSPLADTYDERVLRRVGVAINAVMRGSLLIALIQGAITGIGFFIFGVPNPALWGSVAAIAALVPTFGTTLVNVPAIAFLVITGETSAAFGLALWAAIAVGAIDNLLGPKLVGQSAHLHPLIVLLSVLGGVSFFGPIGILLGPLTFSTLFAVWDIYMETREGGTVESA